MTFEPDDIQGLFRRVAALEEKQSPDETGGEMLRNKVAERAGSEGIIYQDDRYAAEYVVVWWGPPQILIHDKQSIDSVWIPLPLWEKLRDIVTKHTS